MKILHCCLMGPYTEHTNYQENILARQNRIDGHEVMIIASTECYKNGKIESIRPEKYENEDGVTVVRVPFVAWMPSRIAKKLRVCKNVYPALEQYRPDVILFHGIGAYELLNVIKYKKKYPNVKLYVDSHADCGNSAHSWFSKIFLHKIFYKGVLDKALPYVEKILCISLSTLEFVKEIYGVADSKLEIYPLGGTVLDDLEYESMRDQGRKELDLKPDQILFVHSGKMGKLKRTLELLQGFCEIREEKFRLVIAGVFLDEIKTEAEKFIASDPRITFVGWKRGDEILKLLAAADMYLQPGSPSATMQNAMCCRCALMLYPILSYRSYLRGNGFFVTRDAEFEKNMKMDGKQFLSGSEVKGYTITQILERLKDDPQAIEKMKKNSLCLAEEMLDYRKLASRLYR